jgi:hypothetical protein
MGRGNVILRPGSAKRFLLLFLGVAASALALPRPARAAEASAPVPSYALIVGSNAAGPGQQQLRYAERDAIAMAAVLREAGHYPDGHLVVALHPGRAELMADLASLRARLGEAAARGEQAQLIFYYSGHARADAITLGQEELPLAELRQQIAGVPSTLTVVIVDACQSGAFSRIKGAEATADFSFNSVARLNTAGMAVMASSTANELSQESDELASSYFTHNLLLALRGAGDANQDGQVSLDEAYRFTYNRTLAGTAVTAVGAQHATLETALKGKGDVVLTRPTLASSQLVVPARLAGRLFIQHRPSGSVLAELDKAPGAPVRLAVPPGPYEVLLRQGDQVRECDVTLPGESTVTLDIALCRQAMLDDGSVKGGGRPAAPWGLELSLGVMQGREDSYVSVMRQFGFSEYGGNVWLGLSHQISLTATRALDRHFALTIDLLELDAQNHGRSGGLDGGDATFGWSSYGVGAGLRGARPLLRGHLVPYAQVSAGPALGLTTWSDATGTYHQTFFGYYLGAKAGAAFMPWRTLGVLVQAGYYYAPIIKNDLGDTHDSGGFAVQVGTRYAF